MALDSKMLFPLDILPFKEKALIPEIAKLHEMLILSKWLNIMMDDSAHAITCK